MKTSINKPVRKKNRETSSNNGAPKKPNDWSTSRPKMAYQGHAPPKSRPYRPVSCTFPARSQASQNRLKQHPNSQNIPETSPKQSPETPTPSRGRAPQISKGIFPNKLTKPVSLRQHLLTKTAPKPQDYFRRQVRESEPEFTGDSTYRPSPRFHAGFPITPIRLFRPGCTLPARYRSHSQRVPRPFQPGPSRLLSSTSPLWSPSP